MVFREENHRLQEYLNLKLTPPFWTFEKFEWISGFNSSLLLKVTQHCNPIQHRTYLQLMLLLQLIQLQLVIQRTTQQTLQFLQQLHQEKV